MMLKTIIAATVIAWATSAQASAVQCTQTFVESPGPKEREWYNRGPLLKSAFAELLKPTTMELVYEFRRDGTAAVSILDKDAPGAGVMTFAASSLTYSVSSRPNPSRPHDLTYVAIDRQTGALQGTSFRHEDEYDETEMSTISGRCHPVTIPEPKL